MPIPNAFLDSCIYIYPSTETAEAGSSLGASGLIVSKETGDSSSKYYAVTNAHVLEAIKKNGGETVVIRINTKSGAVDSITTQIADWTLHKDGDDVAVHPVNPTEDWRFTHFDESAFLKREYLHDQISLDTPPTVIIPVSKVGDEEKWEEVHKIGVGDDVVVIGKYSQHPGRDKNIPAVRFGHISMVPTDPVEQVERDHFMQESLLVECQSVSGLSGSPVISQTQLELKQKTSTSNSTSYKSMVILVGIDWGHFDLNGEVNIPGTSVKVPSGMMCVVPAWKISEILADLPN
jgi:Trypsin-like peptidase domain